MKTGISLSSFVCLILVAAVGVGCLLGAFRVLDFSVVLQFLSVWAGIEPDTGQQSVSGSIMLGVLGAALALLALMGLSGCVRSPARKGQIAFAGEGGEVTVATVGLEEFIRRAASSIHGVQEAKARVRQKGNDLNIEAAVVLGAARPVMDVTGEIQNRIRVEIEQRLGLPKVNKVKVHVSRMMPELERSKEPTSFSSEED